MRGVTLPSAWWPIVCLRNRLRSPQQPPSSPAHGSSDVRPQQQSRSPFPAGPFWSPSPGAIPAACLRTCWWNSPGPGCAGSVRSCAHPAGLWGSCASSRCYWWRLGRHSKMWSRQMGKGVGIRRNTDQAYFEDLNRMWYGCYTGIYCEPWGGGLGSRDLAPEVNTCPREHTETSLQYDSTTAPASEDTVQLPCISSSPPLPPSPTHSAPGWFCSPESPSHSLGISFLSSLSSLVPPLAEYWSGLYRWIRGAIPWRMERLPTPVFWPGEFQGLQSMGLQRVRHNWATFTFTTFKKSKDEPVLSEEEPGRTFRTQSPQDCSLGVQSIMCVSSTLCSSQRTALSCHVRLIFACLLPNKMGSFCWSGVTLICLYIST